MGNLYKKVSNEVEYAAGVVSNEAKYAGKVIKNEAKYVSNKVGQAKDWVVNELNSKTPPLQKYFPYEVPTFAEITEKAMNKITGKNVPVPVTSNVNNALISTLEKTGEIKKNISGYIDPDTRRITGLAPKGNIATTTPYKRLSKTGSVLTVTSNGFDLANTWTANSGNTILQRTEKTIIQIGGMATGAALGTTTAIIASASGLAEPLTGGLSTGGIAFAVSLDVGGAAIIADLQDKLYNYLDIR